MVVNIEDAGFEIRDQIQWLYGSGFPKSLDVSKAIDKAAGVEREVIGNTVRVDGRVRANEKQINIYGGNSLLHSKTIPQGSVDTLPATEDAKQWEGWGTALKPANEPIVMARKPIEKGLTVAENVIKWGAGAINIDASRIGSEKGRWPANLLLDEQAAEMLDEQSGPCKTGALTGQPRVENKIYGSASTTLNKPRFYQPDTATGASRFFYVAKASKSERNEGLEGLPTKKWAQSTGAQSALARGEIEYRTKTQSGFDTIKECKNHHPTVKPIKLMKYLITLVTPQNGIVLDPFMGSGSTGVAAKELNFDFIGIELSEEYLEIAKRRING
jgi:site-specific DNA-methyltransferase (adenine-specific)